MNQWSEWRRADAFRGIERARPPPSLTSRVGFNQNMSLRWRILYHVDVKKVRFWQPALYGHMVINEDAIFIDGEAAYRIGLYDLIELTTETVPAARMIKIVSREHTFHVLPCLAHIGRKINFALPHRKLLKALEQFAAKAEPGAK